MNIQGKNKFVDFIKRFGLYIGAILIILIVALTFGIMAITSGGEVPNTPVVTKPLEFSLPMQNASILKDFSSTELQKNETLNQWEAHLSIDFSADDNAVYSVLDGTVESVTKSYLHGNIVTIKHSDGFISQYSSLGDELLVSAGDKVSGGQKIGNADTSASGETDMGAHLHFTLSKDGKKVDPNNYLNLQNK